MKPLNDYFTEELVDILCDYDKRKKEIDDSMKIVQAELQRRGLAVLEDRNIKQTEFFGENKSKADITTSQSLAVINYQRLRTLCGEIIDDYVVRKPEIRYDINKRFKEVLIAIFTGDFETEMTVSDILDNNFILDAKQKSLLLKKLKGVYKQDKAAILSVLNKSESEMDIDVELDYIYRAKNWEKIKMFFSEENVESTIEAIRKCIIVESTVKIGVKYEDDEEQSP